MDRSHSEYKLGPHYMPSNASLRLTSGNGGYQNTLYRVKDSRPTIGQEGHGHAMSSQMLQPQDRTSSSANDVSKRSELGDGALQRQTGLTNRTSWRQPAGISQRRTDDYGDTAKQGSLLNLGSMSQRKTLQVTYARLYRKVFLARVKRMHLLMILSSLALSILSFMSTKDSWHTRVYYLCGADTKVWSFAVCLYLGILPVHVLKKSRMTTRRRRYLSNLERIQSIFLSKSVLLSLFAFLLSTAVILFGYTSTRSTPTHYFDLLLQGSRRPQINERLLFILWSATSFAAISAVQYVVKEEDCIVFPIHESSMGLRLAKRFVTRLRKTLPTVVSHTAFSWLMYRVCRRTFYTTLRASLLRPWFAMVMRKNLVTLELVLHAFLLNSLLSCCCAFVNVVVEVYCTQLITTMAFTPTPIESLIDGISVSGTTSSHQKLMAFGELCDVAIRVQRLRVDLFRSISTSPTAFRKVSTESLLVIGAGYVRLVRHLEQLEQSTAGTSRTIAAKTATAPKAEVHRLTEPRNEPAIFVQATNQKSLLERFFQTQKPAPSAAPTASEDATGQSGYIAETRNRMLRIFGSEDLAKKTEEVTGNVIAAASSTSTSSESKKAKFALIQRLLPLQISTALLEPKASYQASVVFEDGYLQMLAIRALTYLIAASYLEDSYGTVQQDLSKTLEALCAYLIAIEKYEDLTGSHDHDLSLGQKAWSGPIKIEIEMGIIRILIAFNKHLSSFPMTRQHAQKLRELIDRNGL